MSTTKINQAIAAAKPATGNRPGWQALIAALDRPGVSGVIVDSLDRSHRNVREFLSFYDDFLEPRGQTLISLQQNIDLATADGRLIGSILMAYAESESRKASERMSGTLRHIVDQGWHLGRVPFGCDRQDKILTPSETIYLYDPAGGQAATAGNGQAGEPRLYHDALRAMYEWYATGDYSATELALALNEAGWRNWRSDRLTPQPFTGQTIRSVITRWALYAGGLPVTRASVYRDRIDLEGRHAPILPPDLCRRVAGVLDSRKHGYVSARSRRRLYLLSGILSRLLWLGRSAKGRGRP